VRRSRSQTKEPQYQRSLELARAHGSTRLGYMANQVYHDDPRRIGFVFARYKFVAKMLQGTSRVLEVGCADGFGTRVVQQHVGKVVGIDFDPVFVADVQGRQNSRWRWECRLHDILKAPVRPRFDAAYALDVLEHIPRSREGRFIRNMQASVHPRGVVILGTPSLESQKYASPQSRQGHVNCKTAAQLKAFLSRHFRHVFLFSMNDEVVHTGFPSLSHYNFALCLC